MQPERGVEFIQALAGAIRMPVVAAVLAHRLGAVQVDSGPADPAMRRARVCYDHLAGDFGVLVFDSLRQRRALCLSCLDWSVRRPHLAGAIGAALLDRFFALRWAARQKGTRVVMFSAVGERALRARFAFQPLPRMNRS